MLFQSDIRPETFEEKALWHCVIWTYGYYLLGALYVLGPALGWLLVIRQARRTGLGGLPFSIKVWIFGMLLMLLSLLVAHAQLNLGLGPMLKSSVGWAKGWALIPLFMIVGTENIRLELLARAASILGIHTLLILPVVAMAWAVGLPGHLYISPISIVGGPGPEYFAVELYGLSPDNGMPRWRLFAPWAPAIGMVMCVYFFLVAHEKNRNYRWAGMLGILLSILASSSRLGLMCIPLVAGFSWMVLNVTRPIIYFIGSPIALVTGLLLDQIQTIYENLVSGFHGARADSSRVRATLGRIAVDRWSSEAVLWGHGAVERGPHLVEYMPIGSHHTWFGLLFVKGIFGVMALALPLVWTFLVLARWSSQHDAAKLALQMLILIFVYTFAENLEILSYLYWPALVVIGLGLRDAQRARQQQQALADPPLMQGVQAV